MSDGGDKLSSIYDVFMMIVIIISIIPLAIKSKNEILTYIDAITVFIFIIDYFLRLFTADYKLQKKAKSFLIYPFTPRALIDLISILPSVSVLNGSLRLFKIIRLLRTFRVFRVFKAFRYSKNITIIVNVFKRQKDSLMIVCVLAVGYILISALVVLNVEPETFNIYFDAVYWATVSLTTVGYGDLYAVSLEGKIITMISSLFGIAIVALPAGIVTPGYMEEINKRDDDKHEND